MTMDFVGKQHKHRAAQSSMLHRKRLCPYPLLDLPTALIAKLHSQQQTQQGHQVSGTHQILLVDLCSMGCHSVQRWVRFRQACNDISKPLSSMMPKMGLQQGSPPSPSDSSRTWRNQAGPVNLTIAGRLPYHPSSTPACPMVALPKIAHLRLSSLGQEHMSRPAQADSCAKQA